MALQKQPPASFPFVGGVDTRTNPLQLRPPKMAEATNIMFVPGGIEKRPGLQKLVELAYAGTPVKVDVVQAAIPGPVVGARMVANRGDDLWLLTDTGALNYAPARGAWHDPNLTQFGLFAGFPTTGNSMPLCSVREGRILSISSGSLATYVGSNSGRSLGAYSSDGFYVVAYATDFIDFYDASGAYLATSTVIGGVQSVVSLGSAILLIQAVGGTGLIKVIVVTKNDIGKNVLTGELSQIANDLNANGLFDVVSLSGGRALLAYSASAANTIKYGWIDNSGAYSSGGSQATANPPVNISVAIDPSNLNFCIAYSMSTSNRIDARMFNQAGAALFAAVTVSVTGFVPKQSAPQATNIVSAFPSAGIVDIFWDNGFALATGRTVSHARINSAGAIPVAENTVMQYGEIISRAFVYGGSCFLLLVQGDTRDSFVFTINSRVAAGIAPGANAHANVVGQVMQGSTGFSTNSITGADGISYGGSPPVGMMQISPSRFAAVIPKLINGAGLDGAGIVGPQHLRSVEIDFADPDAHVAINVGMAVYITGAMMRCIDGKSCFEAGPLIAPYKGFLGVPSAGAGGLLPSTVYHYRAFLRLYTASGERFSSTAQGFGSGTDAVDFTVTTGVADNQISLASVQWPTDVTLHQLMGVEWFRREQGGTVFHKCIGAQSSTDTMSEATLIQQELDPISIGLSQPVPPPPCTMAAVGQGRVFISGLPDPDAIMYSLERGDGEPLMFASENTVAIEAGDGPITAIACVDDVLFAFRSHQAYLILGTPLNNTATIGGFQGSRLVSTDVGCTEPMSIVNYPGGIIFKSSQGFMSMDAGGSMKEIGGNFAKGSIEKISSAVSLQSIHQVRFLTASRTYVYDYEFDQWSIWTSTGIDSCLWKGTYLVLPGSTGKLLQEVGGTYLDDGSAYSMVLETAWIPGPGGMQGRMQLYQAFVMGAYVGPHQLFVQFAYDGQPGWSEIRSWLPTSVIGQAGAAFGAGTFGSGVFGGQNGSNDPATTLYRMSVKPLIQRCSMVKLRISDGPAPGLVWNGGSCTLAEMALVIGVKDGAAKLGPGRMA